MSKQVITVEGEEQVVREDTAKAFRGVHWAFLSIAAFLIIMAIMFFSGLISLTTSPEPVTTPISTEERAVP